MPPGIGNDEFAASFALQRYCQRNLLGCRGRERPRAATLSDKVEPVETHHLVPGSHEVTHELLLRVVLCVDLREGS